MPPLTSLVSTLACALTAGLLCALADAAIAVARMSDQAGPGAAGALLSAASMIVGIDLCSLLAVGLIVGLGLAAVPAAAATSLSRVRVDRDADRHVFRWLAATLAGTLLMGILSHRLYVHLIAPRENKSLAALATALGVMALCPLALLAGSGGWRLADRIIRWNDGRPGGSLSIKLLVALATGVVGAFALVVSRLDWYSLDYPPFLALLVFLAALALLRALPRLRRLPDRLSARPMVLVGISLVLGWLPFGYALFYFNRDARVPPVIMQGAPLAHAMVPPWRRLLDRDGDGFAALLGGGDCDDRDPTVYPGAPDRAGDVVTRDCSARAVGATAPARVPAPIPTPAPPAPVTPAADPNAAKPVAVKTAKRPLNFLLITVDTLRADHLGFFGYGRPTSPRMDELAGQSVAFMRAYAQAPNTPRSFPSLLTSRYPSQVPWVRLNANFSPLRKGTKTFFSQLAQKGYHCSGIFSHFYFSQERNLSDGFVRWDNAGALTLPESNTDIAAPRILPRVVAELKQLGKAAAGDRGKPFALWTHFFEPHSRYMVHAGGAHFGKSLLDKYDGEIAFVDGYVGQLLDALKREGLADSTVVVLFGDHGEAFGEHKLYFHGQTLYDELLHVPLFLRVPGQTPRKVGEPVGLIDLGPTLIELADAEPLPDARGRSLVSALAPPHGGRHPLSADRPLLAELLPAPSWPHSAKALWKGAHKLYWKISDNLFELYDLAADPNEKRNLAASDKERVAALLAELRAAVKVGPAAPAVAPPPR